MRTDWLSISETEFVFENGCWNTCGGGFCCNQTFPGVSFQILPKFGTTLVYLPEEYNFLKKNGFAVPDQVNEISLDYGGLHPVRIFVAHCGLLGRCEGKLVKPILCRVYPFVPIFDLDRHLIELEEASIYDATLTVLGKGGPCTVWNRRTSYLENWKKQKELISKLTTPYIMFHFLAAQAFLKNYRAELSKNTQLLGEPIQEFWETWEYLYLTGALVSTSSLKVELLSIERDFIRKFPSFSLADSVVS